MLSSEYYPRRVDCPVIRQVEETSLAHMHCIGATAGVASGQLSFCVTPSIAHVCASAGTSLKLSRQCLILHLWCLSGHILKQNTGLALRAFRSERTQALATRNVSVSHSFTITTCQIYRTSPYSPPATVSLTPCPPQTPAVGPLSSLPLQSVVFAVADPLGKSTP
ncbi:hypothetical protein EXIGLDRAFT_200316 [Exidia glandulosa HHB12029]|uniref:Uncharacterized protein n=1 Tax=Exidia glandulosa HHB12029 TaxID=1314781 RepID=A0A165ESU0_EXIGL|nr:hypothetical protein EXIGLDRAFT_200316 [Exidia glandulosa HHB12029]